MSENHTPRWMRVGASAALDSARAAREAVEIALEGGEAALVLIFVSPSCDVPSVAVAANFAARGAPLIGCSTAGEIAEGVAGSGRVVAVAMGGEGFVARTSLGLLADGGEVAGAAAAQGLVGLEAKNRALVLLSGGNAGNHGAVVRGAYGVGGASVKMAGGCAADEGARTAIWVIHGGQALQDAVVGAAIGSAGSIGVGLGHGWTPTGESMVVTKSDGQRIFTLDDQPALDRYLAVAGVTNAQFEDPAQWSQIILTRPLGMPRPEGVEVRTVLDGDAANRSLLCGDVPQGAIMSVMRGDIGTALEGAREACVAVLDDLGDEAPVGVLAFDCAGRRSVLGEEGVVAEMATLAEFFDETPLAGFYTYGEVARKSGSRGIHGATLVLLALG